MRESWIPCLCEYCDNPFDASRYDAKYCSDRCRKAASRARNRRAAAKDRLYQMVGQFSEETRATYHDVIAEYPYSKDFFIDLIERHNFDIYDFSRFFIILWNYRNGFESDDERYERETIKIFEELKNKGLV